jgi:hypothetical protein
VGGHDLSEFCCKYETVKLLIGCLPIIFTHAMTSCYYISLQKLDHYLCSPWNLQGSPGYHSTSARCPFMPFCALPYQPLMISKAPSLSTPWRTRMELLWLEFVFSKWLMLLWCTLIMIIYPSLYCNHIQAQGLTHLGSCNVAKAWYSSATIIWQVLTRIFTNCFIDFDIFLPH